MDTPIKRCTKCGQEFPATAEYFHRHKGNTDGLRYICKACAIERSRAWEVANPDRKAETKHARYIANRKLHAKKQRAWYEANREHVIEHVCAWQKANPDKVRAKAQRRRARKQGVDGKHTAKDIAAQYQRQKGRCYWCGVKVGDTYHVDHCIPLSRGGSNGAENLVIACPTCNLSKGSKLPHEWDGSGGKLL